jgi:hypothetical protein
MNYNCSAGEWNLAVASFKGPTWHLDKANKHGVKKVIFSQLLVEYHTNYCQVVHDNYFTVSTSGSCYVPSTIHQQLLSHARLAGKYKLHQNLAIKLLFVAMNNHYKL